MNSMSKRIAASAVSALIAISMVQTATAGERTRHRAAATTSEQVRNANASAAPFYVDQDEYSRYRNGALSAPAGH
jgi:putative heme iron utilization protein